MLEGGWYGALALELVRSNAFDGIHYHYQYIAEETKVGQSLK